MSKKQKAINRKQKQQPDSPMEASQKLEPGSGITFVSLRWELPAFFVAALLVVILLLRQSPNTPACDGLYHLRHAWFYAKQGIWMTEFPWLPYSIISRHAGDIWYGYHVYLIPFSLIEYTFLQLKVTAVCSMVLLMLLLYWIMRRSKFVFPYLWPFLLVLVLPWRLVQIRPHVISIGLAALLFSFMIEGALWTVFAASMALTFIHLTFFWLVILIAVVVLVVRRKIERIWEWKKPTAAIAGMLAGWLLRPNPLGTAKVLYAQTFLLMAEKQERLLSFGRELFPMQPAELAAEHGFFVLIWAVAAVCLVIYAAVRNSALSSRERILLWSSFVLSAIFFVMTLSVSKRAIDQWAPFAFILTAGIFTYAWTALKSTTESKTRSVKGRYRAANRRRLIYLSAGVLLFLPAIVISLNSYVDKMRYGVNPYRLREPAEWLRKNARPGELIFHANWGNFPELFYWNPQNCYTGGMDPIFQYLHDEELYWKAHHLLYSHGTEFTWGTADTAPSERKETYRVLREDFKASYLLVEKRYGSALLEYLSRDERFTLCFEDRRVAIFRIN